MTAQTTGPRSLLIAGLPRCGTTLLATFLASQRHVSFLTDYVTSFTVAASQLGIHDWRAPLDRTQRRIALAMVRDELLRFRHPVLVGIDGFETLRDLHEALLRELARPEDRVVGHKLLLSAEQIPPLVEQTTSTIVVLYRDPRDAALSYFHRTGGGVEVYLERWLDMVRLAKTFHHPRFIAIQYETMVSAPTTALGGLADRLGLELDAERTSLVFNRGAAGSMPWAGNASDGHAAGPFEAYAIGRWRNAPASPIVRYAACTCRRELRQLGYPEGPSMSLLETSRWHAHRTTHQLIRHADRSWERSRARLLSLAAPTLRARSDQEMS